MWTYNYTPSTDELYHHGILGQKWGVRNGPPYPLGSGKHSTAEKKAGWQKSLDKSGSDGDNKRKLTRSSRLSGAAPTVVKSSSGSDKQKNESKRRFSLSNLTDDQKRLIKKGAIVAGSLLAAYVTYKMADSGQLRRFAEKGKQLVQGDAYVWLKKNEDFAREMSVDEIKQTFLKRINPNYDEALGTTMYIRIRAIETRIRGASHQNSQGNGSKRLWAKFCRWNGKNHDGEFCASCQGLL